MGGTNCKACISRDGVTDDGRFQRRPGPAELDAQLRRLQGSVGSLSEDLACLDARDAQRRMQGLAHQVNETTDAIKELHMQDMGRRMEHLNANVTVLAHTVRDLSATLGDLSARIDHVEVAGAFPGPRTEEPPGFQRRGASGSEEPSGYQRSAKAESSDAAPGWHQDGEHRHRMQKEPSVTRLSKPLSPWRRPADDRISCALCYDGQDWASLPESKPRNDSFDSAGAPKGGKASGQAGSPEWAPEAGGAGARLRFRAALPETAELGFAAVPGEAALVVASVGSGAAGAWNAEQIAAGRAEQCLRSGDRIVAVDGVEGVEAMLSHLRGASCDDGHAHRVTFGVDAPNGLTLDVERWPAQIMVELRREGQNDRLGFNFEVAEQDDGTQRLLVGKVHTGLLDVWNRNACDCERPWEVVRTGDVLQCVNGVGGSVQLMLQALQESRSSSSIALVVARSAGDGAP